MDETPSSTQTASLQWDEHGQPQSEHFGDLYFSRENGLEESEFVFLKHNALADRFASLQPGAHFTIVETGFGTGLNFLNCWRLWASLAPDDATLNFVSIEKYPLQHQAMSRALALWPEHEQRCARLLEQYPPQPWTGTQRLHFQDAGPQVTLTLHFMDIHDAFAQMAASIQSDSAPYPILSQGFSSKTVWVDAWFLDGFAPACNPDMWCDALFLAMRDLSHSASTFATFTAAGAVRRGLISAGFECKKVPGYGRKREMLCGTKAPEAAIATPTATRAPTHNTWLLSDAPPMPRESETIVVGAGIAGAHVAHALACAGQKVTVVDRSGIAAGASGNAQGAVYTKLSDAPDALSRFNLSAQWFAEGFYRDTGLYTRCGAQCGVFHLARNDAEAARYQRLALRFQEDAQGFIQWLSAAQASERAGIVLNQPGLWLPRSGWLDPRRLCQALLDHPNIRFLRADVEQLRYDEARWHLDSDSATLSAERVVLCSAHSTAHFAQCRAFDTQSVRGQVTHLPALPALQSLNTVVCGQGYLAPAHPWEAHPFHCVGASFNLNDDNPDLTIADHQHNLDALGSVHPRVNDALPDASVSLSGRVGFRCTTRDYFPIVGPVPNMEAFIHRYQGLRHNANLNLANAAPVHPGLYVATGLGSRGLAYAPLIASLLTDLVLGRPLSTGTSLYRHLHPARFLIRKLIRQQL